ncbi:hypothetical protein UFOVP84_87 [uncultured Caudovirales phage]|uniref:Uncharacterized protein n=1 Tax=uncultured Caudovirales phage TaxID=2100421 RepID=A0A6J5KXJ7_9CAUD|nr:hypothetical protein UFOVP84_87 [uncultured Caudovirales phage]
MDYLNVGLIVLSIGIGYFWGVRRTINKFESGELYIEWEDNEEYYDEEDEPIGDNDILSYIEVHDDVFYMYDEKHTYLSHGDTIELLQDRLRDRFPNKRFAITHDNLEKTGII